MQPNHNAFLFIFLATTASLPGMDIPSQLHGSASQSYIKTFDHDFLIKNSKQGTFEYTEVNLNVFQQFEHLGIGAQLLARDFGTEGNFKTVLDWGYGDYLFNDAFGIKAGKVKLPIGLYSEYRDVDAARMEIFFPQVFNPEDYRDAAEAYEGVGIHGNISAGDNDLIYYHLFWGTNSVRDDFFLVKDTKDLYERSTGGISQRNMSMSTDHLRGAHLVWNMDQIGVRLSYNHISYAGSFNVAYHDFGSGQTVDENEALRLRIKWNIFSAEWTNGPWSFSSELLLRDNHYTHSAMAQANGFPEVADVTKITAWYVTARRQWDHLGTYLSFGSSDIDLGHLKTTLNAAGTPVPKGEYFKELSTGIRYDFNEHMLGKLQITHYWGYSQALDSTSNFDKNWEMISARLTFHF